MLRIEKYPQLQQIVDDVKEDPFSAWKKPYLRNPGGGLGGSFCEMSVSWSPKSGRVEILDVSPKRRAGFGPDKLENGPDFLRRMALKAPWIRDIHGKERGTLKLSDVGSCLLYTSPSPRDRG